MIRGTVLPMWGSLVLASVALTTVTCSSQAGDVDGGQPNDGDVVADSDTDADVERDLSRCGTGGEVCGDCHGNPRSASPPPDLEGRIDVSEMTVGTHQQHMLGSALSVGGACTDCHREPSEVLDLRHCDSPPPAEVVFGGVAIADGAYPFWDRTTGTCLTVYCHGATLDGGPLVTPPWTDPTPLDCGDCHAMICHGSSTCECHTRVWLDGQILNPALHINGQIDL